MTIPTGLTLRSEFRKQHDEGKETSRGGTTTTPPLSKPDIQQPDPRKNNQTPATGTGDCMDMLPMVVLMVVVFYFFLIRPQKKQEKQLKTMRAALKKGDRIVTSGGMHAIVTTVQDDVVSVRPSMDGPIMTFDASAIGRVITDEGQAADAKDDVKKIDNGKSDGGQTGG